MTGTEAMRMVQMTCVAGLVVALGFSSVSARQTKRGAADPKLAAIPEPFRESVGEELAAGMKIAETRETTAAGGRYLVAIYEFPENDTEHGGDKALKIYFLRDGAKTPMGKDLYVEHYVDFGTYDDPKAAFADVNRDGKTEMIASVGNGGNCWECSRVLLYTLEGDELKFLASEPMTIKDIDGDGVMELLVGDTRWEAYDDFSHAGAPGGTLVYAWHDGGYVFAGKDARAYYDKELADLRADLDEAAQGISADDPYSDERYLHDVLSMYMIYTYTEQLDRGREELLRLMSENVPNDDMRKRRLRIIDDFLNGDSAKMLERPKRGQSLPGGSQ